MMFSLLSAVMVGVKYKSDKRDRYLHHGGWLAKAALWALFNVLPFFFPNGLVNAYCEQLPWPGFPRQLAVALLDASFLALLPAC